MEGYVVKGRLIYVNTDKKEIQIQEEPDIEGRVATPTFQLGDYTLKPETWEDMLGEKVKCIIVDKKIHDISTMV